MTRDRSAWFVIALAAVVIPLVSEPYTLNVWTFVAINALVVMGLDVLFGWAGQLSLGHGVFVTVGAYATALLTIRLDMPALLAMLIGVVATCLLAVLVGLATLRLRGFYLAMATLGFPVIADSLLQTASSLTGGSSGLAGIPSISVAGITLGSNVANYLTAVTLGAIAAVVLTRLVRSRFGLALKAVHDDEEAAESRGLPTSRYKILALVISVVLASLAGSLYAHFVHFVAPATFGLSYSILLVVMLVVGGRGTLWGGVLGAIVLTWLPQLFSVLSEWQPVLYGGVLGLVMILAPGGIASLVPSRRLEPAQAERRTTASAADLPEFNVPSASKRGGRQPVLAAADVAKSFGGVQAVQDVSLTVAPGEARGVIGPNGAGKSTLLGILGGQTPPDHGAVQLLGAPLSFGAVHTRARSGLGRTFQHVRLFHSLSAEGNVRVSASQAGASHGDVDTVVDQVLTLTGLTAVRHEAPEQLTHRERRFLEIACALAGRPAVLLLDEPAGGLAANEIDDLLALLRTVQQRGVALVVVDHVMDLIVQLCTVITVMQNGQVLAEGPPSDVLSDDRVRKAYLGSKSVT